MTIIFQVIPVAFGAAVSPFILTVVILTLSGQNFPKIRTIAVILGCTAVVVIIGVIGLTLTGLALPKAPPKLSGSIDIFLGILLLYLGIKKYFSRESSKKSPAVQKENSAHLIKSFYIGVLIMITNLTTLVLYIEAIKIIAEAKVGIVSDALNLSVVIFIILLPGTIPLLIDLIFPSYAKKALGSVNKFVVNNEKYIMIIFMSFFGLYLMIKGAFKL